MLWQRKKFPPCPCPESNPSHPALRVVTIEKFIAALLELNAISSFISSVIEAHYIKWKTKYKNRTYKKV
jgi:hypothetical protein